eukprot:s82_g10.t1
MADGVGAREWVEIGGEKERLGMSELGSGWGKKESLRMSELEEEDARTAADPVGARELVEMGGEKEPLGMSELGCADGCGGRGVWHPERCRQLCEEASQVSNCVPALLISGASGVLEETSTMEAPRVPIDQAEELQRWSSGSVLMRLPVLCKFLASLAPAMLGHRLCDLAFCSYAWSEPSALRMTTLPSAPHPAPAQRIVQAALEQSLMEEVSMEEKQAAFGMRRSAGRWALDLISAKDFLRFFICAHLAAEGLQLMQLFGSKATSVDAEVWKRISEAFEVGDDGFQWLQRQAPEFSKQAKLALGELQEPDEKLTLLLRSNKPSHSHGEPLEKTQPT